MYLELVTQGFEEGVMLKRRVRNRNTNARVGTQETERKQNYDRQRNTYPHLDCG